jgi:tellurite resistance protein TerC
MIWFWIGFILFVLLMLAIDLGVFHRQAHAVSVKEALVWSAVWITMAMIFNGFIYFAYSHHWLGIGRAPDGSVMIDKVDGLPLNGHNAAIKFFTGYVIEKSLSVDNIFVIALIFAFFKIPNKYQHRVLFWGILGALIMRGVFIGLGAALIAKFHWILYVFGVFLIYTGFKMLRSDADPDPQNSRLVRWARRWFPITHELHGQHFLIPRSDLHAGEAVEPPLTDDEAAAGKVMTEPVPAKTPAATDAMPRGTSRYVLTPLALALIVVEGTDLIFAVDSIPAIFAITADSFLVFTSNIFAVLGLRALYFALAGILDKFHHLKTSLAIVLILVGVKMLAADWLKQFEFLKKNLSFVTLGLIAIILAGGVIASLMSPRRPTVEPPHAPET